MKPKPCVIYTPGAEKYIQPLIDLGPDRVTVLPATTPPEKIPPANATFMRIVDRLRYKTCADAYRLEKNIKSHGSRILNPVARKFSFERKDVAYRILEARGFRVPYQLTTPVDNEARLAVEAGLLKYPMVLRAVDGMQGQDTRLLSGDSDLVQSLKEFDAARDRSLLCEFFDTKDAHGYYHKWRIYIYGGQARLWEAGISRQWKVNLANNTDFEPADFCAANEIKLWPSEHGPRLAAAAAVLGLDICALDVLLPEGRKAEPVIVDVNTCYGFTADIIAKEKGWTLFPPDVAAIRKDHWSELVEWMAGLKHGA